jgi:hypothetical protein
MEDMLVTHVLEQIPFDVDLPLLKKRLRIKDGSASEAELVRLLEEAIPIARPRALYVLAYIDERGNDWVKINGQVFSSRVLAVNLAQAHRVFPYLATCGPELEEWAAGHDDMLHRFWAEAIKERALFCAIRAVAEHIEVRYRPGPTARMNPGSLADWPLEQQAVFFTLLAGRQDSIGVRLTESMLMVPSKSVSGIHFPTEVAFENCELCPREGCPGRRAIYNPELYDNRYCSQPGG